MKIILALALGLIGCAQAGVSRDRCKVLLSQARQANRECHRLIVAYDQADCVNHPAQDFSALNFGEGGQ